MRLILCVRQSAKRSPKMVPLHFCLSGYMAASDGGREPHNGPRPISHCCSAPKETRPFGTSTSPPLPAAPRTSSQFLHRPHRPILSRRHRPYSFAATYLPVPAAALQAIRSCRSRSRLRPQGSQLPTRCWNTTTPISAI